MLPSLYALRSSTRRLRRAVVDPDRRLVRFSVVLMLGAGVSACGARDPLTAVISDAPAPIAGLEAGVDARDVSTERDAPGDVEGAGVVDAAHASDATADAGGAPTCAMALDPTFG